MTSRAHPYATGKANTTATTSVAILLFLLSLSALNTVGLVPDYVDGTGTLALDSVSVHETQRDALPDEQGRLALNDIPRLGDEVVLTPIVPAPTVVPEVPVVVAPLAEPIVVATPIQPERVIIHSLNIDVPVSNPETTDVAALDAALLTSVVRYPLSAELNQDGNVFIFGHSSHLPVVKNQMFKAFNEIEKLNKGDTIKLMGKDESHIYRVTSVKQVDAKDALIDLSPEKGKRLTLSTCDSFGGKSSRWVVEAEFVGAYAGEDN
ncbi:MAG: sortase [Candidatus Pacebacteria bacterium]|nr:sortase [Candidatus Paceibacterota bacterium]